MEILKHFRGFLLILSIAILCDLAVIGDDFLISNEAQNVYLSLSTGKTSTSLEFEKYILELYFRKFDHLDDLHFEDFLANELTIGSCESLSRDFEIRKQSVEQTLIGEGSHRILSSTIRLTIKEEFFRHLSGFSFEVVIIEQLPSGVFADPFELQHLHQHGVFKEIAVFGETNLELPSFLCNKSAVEVHVDINSSILPKLTKGLDIKLDLPLHAQYQPLGEDGSSEVELSMPYLLMIGSTKNAIDKDKCLLAFKDIGSRDRFHNVVWSIPAGIKAHGALVSVATFTSAIISTLAIVIVSIFYSDNELNRKWKQS